MGIYLATYYALILLSIVLSFVAVYNGHKRYLTLLLVLIFTQIVEVFAVIFSSKGQDHSWMYHLFVPIEYGLLALYLRLAINVKKIKKAIAISIPVVCTFSYLISW